MQVLQRSIGIEKTPSCSGNNTAAAANRVQWGRQLSASQRGKRTETKSKAPYYPPALLLLQGRLGWRGKDSATHLQNNTLKCRVFMLSFVILFSSWKETRYACWQSNFWSKPVKICMNCRRILWTPVHSNFSLMIWRSLGFLGQWRTARAGRSVKHGAAVDTMFSPCAIYNTSKKLFSGEGKQDKAPEAPPDHYCWGLFIGLSMEGFGSSVAT